MDMLLFWIIAISVGILGGLSDVCADKWGANLAITWWVITGMTYLLFMTGFGLLMRFGAPRGYPLSVVVLAVLLANIATAIVWDVVKKGTHLNAYQVVGIFMAIAAALLLKFGAENA